MNQAIKAGLEDLDTAELPVTDYRDEIPAGRPVRPTSGRDTSRAASAADQRAHYLGGGICWGI